MRVWRRLSPIALVCLTLCPLLTICPLPAFAAAPSDQAAAERVLGPQWQHLARRAGIIFSGTVLTTSTRFDRATNHEDASSKLRLDGDVLEVRFRIDRSIAGVQPGQVLTIREWIGASSRQPALRSGERILLFLYPPSRLGLTSPVGGPQGQIRLDSTGHSVARQAAASMSKSQSAHGQDLPAVPKVIPVSQLERAIRGARGE